MSIISTFQSPPLGDVSADMKQAGVNPAAHALSHDINPHHPRYLHLHELLSLIAIKPQFHDHKSRKADHQPTTPQLRSSHRRSRFNYHRYQHAAIHKLHLLLQGPQDSHQASLLVRRRLQLLLSPDSLHSHVKSMSATTHRTAHNTAHSTQHTQSCKTELRAPEHFEHGIRE
jgi:hypothetical protein